MHDHKTRFTCLLCINGHGYLDLTSATGLARKGDEDWPSLYGPWLSAFVNIALFSYLASLCNY
ncbi:hypothetical protein F5X98DRAFT_339959 [Xylaria grammica]|nr:hypothetical protein F5X98DRAFT_339959 [Xylaria grammica]